ncbi:hypothetical protein DV515_00002050 [Chloebia gouldiae]|uniref:Uncharacterized protein n=1 Tax=Chloebia gouldiae TaxID=44316 RepID=A0A3L8SXN0_CHLGU|nr:hypothetical protein DV515_00002050 [Chloebia gouldiae]
MLQGKQKSLAHLSVVAFEYAVRIALLLDMLASVCSFVVSINSTQNRYYSGQAGVPAHTAWRQGSCHGSGGKGAQVLLFLLQEGIVCVTRQLKRKGKGGVSLHWLIFTLPLQFCFLLLVVPE